MHIITLTEKKYNEFSKKHDKRNYKQTVEYANFMSTNNYQIVYLGLEDNNNDVVAATLILEKTTKGKFKIGYAPNGFLIDFNNKVLLETFTIELKKHLNNLNYIYLNLDPNFAYRIFDKNKLVTKCYPNILDNMKNLGYVKLNKENKLEAFLHIKNNINDTYKKFDRNIKRKIKDSNLMGLTFYQENDIEKFYSLIEKKNSKNIDYYKNIMKHFNNEDCKFEIFFAKINSEIYLNNYRYLLKNELEKNYKLQEIITNPNIQKTFKLVNNKINSDKLLHRYQNKVIEASQIFSNYPDGVIVATCAIIRTDNTIYFIEEGYNDKLRNIYSLPTLKWEIIKTYYNKNYRNFNLGRILTLKSDNKHYGISQSKIGFNPKIYEYPGSFDLVINKYIYTIMNKNIQTLLPKNNFNVKFNLKNYKK